MTLIELTAETQKQLSQRVSTFTDHLPEVILHGFLTAMRLHHEAILVLTPAGHLSACAPLVQEQIEMRVKSIILCSDRAPFAVRIFSWFEELNHRLRYLNLEHIEQDGSHLEILLAHCGKREEGDLIRKWFGQKPQPEDTQEAWLRNWPLWNVERLIFEVQKNLVTSPRVRKELEGFLDFARDHASPATFRGIKRFAFIDEDLNRVTFCQDGEERWTQGPLTISTVAILDTLADISQAFTLDLGDAIDAARLSL